MSWSLQRPDYTTLYFSELMTSDDQARSREARRLAQEISAWALNAEQSPQRSLLAAHLGTVLRLAHECPFNDVRDHFRNLLESLPAEVAVPRRVWSGPSRFMPAFTPVPMGDAPGREREAELYREMFFHDGRCSHMVQLMMCFPEYLEAFIRTLHYVMRCDGPLPLAWRTYVAIMAVSRYNCGYLMHLLETQYLAYGGAPKWLEGIRHAPARLQNLQELNCILAHQPWLMRATHIQGLVRGADSWSMSELAQIAVILTTYHSLCGFVYGMGVAPEADSADGHTYATAGDGAGAGAGDEAAGQDGDVDIAPPGVPGDAPWADRTARALKVLTAREEEDDDSDEESPAQRLVSFVAAEGPSIGGPGGGGDDMHLEETDLAARFTAAAQQPGKGWPLRALDFNTRDTAPFRIQDYSWQDHAFSQLNRFYGVAQLLDDEFAVAFGMTDNQLGDSKELDTTKFRQAVWNYIHRLNGIFHDDYDYQEVNKLLDIAFKTYIKKVACYPSLVTAADFAAFGAGLRDAEKIHINILVMEARKQAPLLFFLHSAMLYMNT